MNSKPVKGFAALTAVGLIGLMVGLIAGGGPAGADLNAISADAFGHQRTVTVLNAIPLPPGLLSFSANPSVSGPNQNATTASSTGLAYSTGPLSVVTTGSTGAAGQVTSTANAAGVTAEGGTIVAGVLLPANNDFHADSIVSTCHIDAAGLVTHSVTLNGAHFSADQTSDTPIAPGPYTSNTPVVFSSTVAGRLTITVNEVSPANPATTATHRENNVNAVHIHRTILAPGIIAGGPNIPVLDDDIIIGHVHCDADLATAPPNQPNITKTYAASNVAVGGSTTVNLTATNGSAAGGANPTITDTFPAGQTPGNVVGTPNGFNCTTDVPTRTVTCSRATALGAFEPTTIPVPVTCNSTSTNTAAFDNKGGAGPVNSNAATLTCGGGGGGGLAIGKSFNPTTVSSGGTSTATLTATNGNAAGGANPTITDPFPAGQTPGTATANDGFTCTTDVPTRTVSCTKAAAMAANEAATITIPVTATSTATNTASFDNKGGGAPVTGSATLTVTSGQPTIAKGFSPNTVASGGASTATLTATNGNTAGGANPTITDTFPAGQTPGATGTLTANDGFTCTTTGQTVSCTKAAAMAAGEVATVTVPVTATATATNTASFNNQGGGGPVTGSATLTVTGGGAGNPSLAKSFNPSTVASGGTSTATLTATNGNTAGGANPLIADIFPAGQTPGTATANDGFTCTTTGQTVSCTKAAAMAAGEVATITIPLTATATNSNTAGFDNKAAAPVFATATLTVSGTNAAGTSDLSAQKRPGTNFVQNAQAIWLGIISNNGPAASPVPVTLTDTLPTGTTFQSASGGNFTCTASGQTVNCTRPTALQVGEQAIVQIVVLVTAPAGSSVTNTLTVNGGAFDPVLANNTGTDTEVVQQSNSAIYYCPAYGNNNNGGGNQQQQQQQKVTSGSGGTSASSSQQQQGGRGGGMGVSNNSQDQQTTVNGKDGTTTSSGDQSSHNVSMGNGYGGNGYYAQSSPYCPANGNGGNGGGGNQQQQQQ